MENRITDREHATNSTFGYINERGTFEKRDLKQHLINLGIYQEDTRTLKPITSVLSPELKAYYDKLQAQINSLK